MRDFVKDISYRVFYLALAAALIYMLPTLVHSLSEFVAVVFTPLLEGTIQNIGK